MMVIFNKNFIKTIDNRVNILYNIIVRRILKDKKHVLVRFNKKFHKKLLTDHQLYDII